MPCSVCGLPNTTDGLCCLNRAISTNATAPPAVQSAQAPPVKERKIDDADIDGWAHYPCGWGRIRK